ncbi:FtsX-like permease family protein [Fulvivirga sp. M361]|uniref:ABC transporter permease n=1 Tax=Fulvivirga sp. M361 TaxID=2594266 RepID=UPI001179E38E|nr:FtsX-like permease family protein [Fulvivirga sp. M361]TRX51190.1 FtsX-like permease family protein [Fulvivirga sp. M361]
MKLAFILAYKNLIGAGLRTWLNVGILSFAFVLIIFYNGILDGWNDQARRDTIDWEIGQGQISFNQYDPFDPFTVMDGHGVLPEKDRKGLVPVLLRQGTIYPEGRMLSVMIKGIDAGQTALKLPTHLLTESDADIPVIIGKRMAKSARLKKGDEVLIRWRDDKGTYDASSVTVEGVFDCNVSAVDQGQVWMSIDKLWEMTGLKDHTTYSIITDGKINKVADGWNYSSREDLLSDLTRMIAMKQKSSSIMYGLLLTIALLAIFDTQVLSIFRRQKEIGTYIALGMTRMRVVWLFTVEGTMYSFLATVVGCVYGIPFFIYMSKAGMGMPEANQEMGIVVAERIFPVYSAGLILSTVALVIISATVVSFLPSRKIAKMNPVDALKGKMQ